MITPIDERAYDCDGRVTLLPKKRSLNFHPTFAMGTYVTCKCDVVCESLDEVRAFLRACRYATDPDQFGVRDYWMRPDQFEKSRRGDCEDFALWAWWQLLHMGSDARFVLGRVGYGRRFHAWVSFVEDGTHYLFEPLSAGYRKLTRLSVLMHEPELSVAYENGKLVYRQHAPRDYRPSFGESVSLAAEWVPIFLARSILALLSLPWRLVGRLRSRGAA